MYRYFWWVYDGGNKVIIRMSPDGCITKFGDKAVYENALHHQDEYGGKLGEEIK